MEPSPLKLQVSLAALAVRAGVASPILLAAVAADALAGLAVCASLRRARRTDLASPRTVAPGKREVVCLTAGNSSTDAVVIVSTSGAIKFDDLAEGRTPPPGRMSMLGVPLVVGLVGALVIGFARLPIADAWCAAGLYSSTHPTCRRRGGGLPRLGSEWRRSRGSCTMIRSCGP